MNASVFFFELQNDNICHVISGQFCFVVFFFLSLYYFQCKCNVMYLNVNVNKYKFHIYV